MPIPSYLPIRLNLLDVFDQDYLEYSLASASLLGEESVVVILLDGGVNPNNRYMTSVLPRIENLLILDMLYLADLDLSKHEIDLKRLFSSNKKYDLICSLIDYGLHIPEVVPIMEYCLENNQTLLLDAIFLYQQSH